jgi:hypothetical protein
MDDKPHRVEIRYDNGAKQVFIDGVEQFEGDDKISL